jgi:hypothetical protein
MRYRQNERKDLESGPRLYGPEPIFGEYKYESDDNGAVETIRHWSTILTEEVQSSIESDIVNGNSTLTNKNDSKLPANEFPETVEVVVGMDHGQGAMKEYRRMFTLLGSAFSLLRQILPSDSDLQTLEKTIDGERTMEEARYLMHTQGPWSV